MMRIAWFAVLALPIAPPADAQSIRIPATVLEAAWKTAECSIDLKEADTDRPADDLGGNLKLVEFYCWRAAYQAGSIFFAVDPAAPEKARLLRFPMWTGKKKLGTSYSLTSPSYDATKKKLSMAHKGRGVGDCGDIGEWTWNGSDFRLTAFWSKPNCDGKPFDESRRWQVYRAKR